MKKSEIEVGGHYLAKVDGKLVMVRVDRIQPWDGKQASYDVTNLTTGRKTTFRSAAKFRQTINPVEVERFGIAGALSNEQQIKDAEAEHRLTEQSTTTSRTKKPGRSWLDNDRHNYNKRYLAPNWRLPVAKHNGFTNQETWTVAQWLDNDRHNCNKMRELTKAAGAAAKSPATAAWSVAIHAEAASALADQLREWIAKEAPVSSCAVHENLLASAIGRVNWLEIAKEWVEEEELAD